MRIDRIDLGHDPIGRARRLEGRFKGRHQGIIRGFRPDLIAQNDYVIGIYRQRGIRRECEGHTVVRDCNLAVDLGSDSSGGPARLAEFEATGGLGRPVNRFGEDNPDLRIFRHSLGSMRRIHLDHVGDREDYNLQAFRNFHPLDTFYEYLFFLRRDHRHIAENSNVVGKEAFHQADAIEKGGMSRIGDIGDHHHRLRNRRIRTVRALARMAGERNHRQVAEGIHGIGVNVGKGVGSKGAYSA